MRVSAFGVADGRISKAGDDQRRSKGPAAGAAAGGAGVVGALGTYKLGAAASRHASDARTHTALADLYARNGFAGDAERRLRHAEQSFRRAKKLRVGTGIAAGATLAGALGAGAAVHRSGQTRKKDD